MQKITLEEHAYRLTLEGLQHEAKRLADAGDDKYLDRVRLRCQKDLRFLVNCVLRPNAKQFQPMVEKVHGKIIDHFPQLDPDVRWEEWDKREEFVVMASRGMLKSTIGAAFLTQAILCYPDIRILIMSGKIEKAQSILAVARKPFLTNQVIRFLFPDWAIEDDSIRAEDFTTPKRNDELDLRDPTMSCASFDSIKAGGHYELILLDDATNEINSSTPENVEKTHETYGETDELIEPHGYRVFLCTKWLDDDLPEYIRKKGAEDATASGLETVSYFVLPAWTLRTDGTAHQIEQRREREKLGVLKPEDVNLTWPEKLNAEFLFKRYRRNRADFYKHYLLDASIEQTASFTEETLNHQTRPNTEVLNIPMHNRSVVVYWDFASVFSGRRRKSKSDFSCGIVVVFENSTGKMWVVDCVLAHFNSGREIATAMVKLHQAARYWGKVVGHGAENASGAQNLESQIYEIAKEMNVTLPTIVWQTPPNAPNAKNVRIAMLAAAMKGDPPRHFGNVFLCSNMPYIDDVRMQFEKWRINAKSTSSQHDDAPDCIAQVLQYYRPLIRPLSVDPLRPDAPVLDWVDEGPTVAPEGINPTTGRPWAAPVVKTATGEVAEPDYHAEEAENADFEWLNSFTSPHA